jgi:hypothetical protein
MELTVNIREQSKIAAFLTLIKEMDYVEIIDVKEDTGELPLEHRKLLQNRLKRIKKGETVFRNWDLVKQHLNSRCKTSYRRDQRSSQY